MVIRHCHIRFHVPGPADDLLFLAVQAVEPLPDAAIEEYHLTRLTDSSLQQVLEHKTSPAGPIYTTGSYNSCSSSSGDSQCRNQPGGCSSSSSAQRQGSSTLGEPEVANNIKSCSSGSTNSGVATVASANENAAELADNLAQSSLHGNAAGSSVSNGTLCYRTVLGEFPCCQVSACEGDEDASMQLVSLAALFWLTKSVLMQFAVCADCSITTGRGRRSELVARDALSQPVPDLLPCRHLACILPVQACSSSGL